uniref:Calmodulin n=1 Tax=Alexandrium andersonii TaxID=327968 RepID=A0A7S2CIW2_9DINO
MERVGVAVKSPDGLFKFLLSRCGQRSIALSDLKALLVGLPGAERAQAWGAQDHRDEGLFSTAPPMPSPRERADEAHRTLHGQDITANSLAFFKELLIGKFGSLFAAWYRYLDVNRNGTVAQRDFCTACRGIGIEKVQQVWNELDKKRAGLVSFEQFDAETAAAFGEFEKLLMEQYGGTKDGWRKVFDPDVIYRCDLKRFIRGCRKLGYSGNAERLFTLVSPDVYRKYLTYSDLWQDLDPNDFTVSVAGHNLSAEQTTK